MMVHTSFLGDIQEGEHLRMDCKGLWVSLAYTRAFGTLGPQFKSGQTHHFLKELLIYFAIVFAAVSEKIDYRSDELSLSEEE